MRFARNRELKSRLSGVTLVSKTADVHSDSQQTFVGEMLARKAKYAFRCASSFVYLCQGDYIFIGVCLLAGLYKKNHSSDFHKSRWKVAHTK